MNVTREAIFSVVPGAEALVADAATGGLLPGMGVQIVAPKGCFQLQIAKMAAQAYGCENPAIFGVADVAVRTDILAEMLGSPAILGQRKAVIFADADVQYEVISELLPYLSDTLAFFLVEDDGFFPAAIPVHFNWLPRKKLIAALRDFFALERASFAFTYDAGVGDVLYSATNGCPELALALSVKCRKAKRKSEFIMRVTESVGTIKKATEQLYADISDVEAQSLEEVSKKIRDFVSSVPWKPAYLYLARDVSLDALANPDFAVKVGIDDMLLQVAVTNEAQFSMFCLKLAVAARKAHYGNNNVSSPDQLYSNT